MGLVTSQNIGYLFYFFLRMECCCEFDQTLVLKQNIYLTVSGRKSLERRAIFPAKRLLKDIFWTKPDKIQKRRLFFQGPFFFFV